jgi:hypothetical protein
MNRGSRILECSGIEPEPRGAWLLSVAPHTPAGASGRPVVAPRCGWATSLNPPAEAGGWRRPCATAKYPRQPPPLAAKIPSTTQSD